MIVSDNRSLGEASSSEVGKDAVEEKAELEGEEGEAGEEDADDDAVAAKGPAVGDADALSSALIILIKSLTLGPWNKST